MAFPRAARVAVVAVVGLAAGGAAWGRLAPVGPFLEVTTKRDARLDAYELWDVDVKVRGGQRLDEVRVDVVSGPAEVVTPPKSGLDSGVTAAFRVRLVGAESPTAVVRVTPRGCVTGTVDVRLGETK